MIINKELKSKIKPDSFFYIENIHNYLNSSELNDLLMFDYDKEVFNTEYPYRIKDEFISSLLISSIVKLDYLSKSVSYLYKDVFNKNLNLNMNDIFYELLNSQRTNNFDFFNSEEKYRKNPFNFLRLFIGAHSNDVRETPKYNSKIKYIVSSIYKQKISSYNSDYRIEVSILNLETYDEFIISVFPKELISFKEELEKIFIECIRKLELKYSLKIIIDSPDLNLVFKPSDINKRLTIDCSIIELLFIKKTMRNLNHSERLIKSIDKKLEEHIKDKLKDYTYYLLLKVPKDGGNRELELSNPFDFNMEHFTVSSSAFELDLWDDSTREVSLNNSEGYGTSVVLPTKEDSFEINIKLQLYDLKIKENVMIDVKNLTIVK